MNPSRKSWLSQARFFAILALAAGFGPAGCGGGGTAPPKARLPDEGREVFASPASTPPKPSEIGEAPKVAPKPAEASAAPKVDAWSIILVTFHGADREAQAQAQDALRRIRSEAGLTEAFAEQRGESWTVAMGRYADPSSKEAQDALKRAKTAQIEGQSIFHGAFLAPPFGAQAKAASSDYDLRNAVQGLKPNDALYTLQVGVYGRNDLTKPSAAELAEFHKAAVEAATKLRREGEQAYFYRGPTLGMVTVGVFGTKDFDGQTEGPAIQQARQRFPHNLLNGKGRRERVKGVPENSPDAWRMDPSLLVAIPK